MPAAEVGLAAVPGCVENHRVNVNPTAALSDQLNANRSLVTVHAVASPRGSHTVRSTMRSDTCCSFTVQLRLSTPPKRRHPNGLRSLTSSRPQQGGQYPRP